MDITNGYYIELDQRYDLSVDCHLCEKRFECLFKYKCHLKDITIINGMECDFNKCENGNLKSSDKY